MILRRPSYEPFATAILEVQTEDGSFLPAEIRIGRPYPEDTHWACPVEVHGIVPRRIDMRGENAIQPLAMALAWVRKTLDAALDRGLRIRSPGAPDMITGEWLDMLFSGCGAPGAGGSLAKLYDDPAWLAALEVKHISAKSLAELDLLLPNGFHDAMLHSVHLDIVKRRVVLDLELWVDEPPKTTFQDRYRRAVLEIGLAGRCVIEPPDPRYPFREAKPVRIDMSVVRPAADGSPEEVRFFVDEWNSFIIIEDNGGLLTWLDELDAGVGGVGVGADA